jgi:hypothetical protein
MRRLQPMVSPRTVSTKPIAQDRALHRGAVIGLAAFFVFALWGFWPSYYSRLSAPIDIHFHLHGLALTAWCVLLVAEAFLMRGNNRQTHRKLGAVSYVLVPVLAATTLSLVHFRMSGGSLPDIGFYQFALMFNAVVCFVVLYAVAMIYRRQALVHARFMICTIFPLFTPITDRLIYVHWPSLVTSLPALDGVPLVQMAGFALTDVLLVGLIAWDWRKNNRFGAFASALVVLLLYQASVLTFYRFEFWQAFTYWFRSLPLL